MHVLWLCVPILPVVVIAVVLLGMVAFVGDLLHDKQDFTTR